MTSSFELVIDMISMRETLVSVSTNSISSRKEKKTDLLISLGTAPPTRCPLDLYDVIKCCAHRRFNFCYPGCLSRETCVRMSVAFLVISYAPGMHVIASARASSVVRAYLRTICCTHAIRHQKDQTKCQLVNHRSMGACDAFGLPRVRVSRFLRTRR